MPARARFFKILAVVFKLSSMTVLCLPSSLVAALTLLFSRLQTHGVDRT